MQNFMKNKSTKKKEGITLIALVITVIVLLILAAISIIMLTGDNSILKRAVDVKTKSDEAQIRERIQLAYHSALTKDMAGDNGKLTMSTLQEELNKEFIGKTVAITTSADNKEWIIKVDDTEATVPAGKETNPQVAKLPSADGTKPYFPSESFSQVKDTDLSTGLVITDEIDEEGNSIGNEYVWIEVPSTAVEKGTTSGPDYSYVKKENANYYDKIEEALKNYVSENNLIIIGTYSTSNNGKGTTNGHTDTWYEGCGLSSQEYKEYKEQMLESIYKNGGFWIGRYEAGQDTLRTSFDENISSSLKPLSKFDKIPITNVTCNQAQTIAERVENISSTYKSSLMFGIQWDLVLKYIYEKEKTTNNNIKAELTSDSSTWGNYQNSNITLTGGRYYSPYSAPNDGFINVDNSFTKTGEPRVLSTGIIPKTMTKQNIYDLAGNVYEFTLEKAPEINANITLRGGRFDNSGSSTPVSIRSVYNGTSVIYKNVRISNYYLLEK